MVSFFRCTNTTDSTQRLNEEVKTFHVNIIIWWRDRTGDWDFNNEKKKLTGFDITIDKFIIECISFGFPGSSQNTKLINYWILYAKYFIYRNKMNGMDNIGFLGYMAYLKMILTIEQSSCLAMHQGKAFNCFKSILDNL